MITRKVSLFSAFAAALLMCLTATPSARAADVSSGDKHFVMEAAQGGMTEVAAAKVALANASSDDVKKFAQKMIDDHTKANEELMALAKSKNLEVPATLDSKHESMVDKMKGMTGADFDKAYIKDMVKDHKKDVELFEKASMKADDADIKAFAAKTLPTLKEHMTMITAMADGMGMKGGDHDMGGHDAGHDMGK